jgi:hypothetical protein
MRHRRAGEEACAECKKANAKKTPRSAFHKDTSLNAEPSEMDRLIAAQPPVVVWQPDKRGIQVAVYVYDPHVDGGHNREKTHCKRNHEFTPENTMVTATGRQCRTCKALNRKDQPRGSKTFPDACDRGHEFDTWNTIVNPDGSFECRTCFAPQDSPLLSAARTDL